jgi:hypothetical protein
MFRPRETRFASAQGGRFRYTRNKILALSYPGGVDVYAQGAALRLSSGRPILLHVQQNINIFLPWGVDV